MGSGLNVEYFLLTPDYVGNRLYIISVPTWVYEVQYKECILE